MDLPTVETLTKFLDSEPPPSALRFMDAMNAHPPSEGHKWRLIHWGRRGGTVFLCSRCQVPVGEPARR